MRIGRFIWSYCFFTATDASWSCEAVANRPYIDRKQTAELLARLDSDGFVTTAREEEPV